jgi:hypothetical protein
VELPSFVENVVPDESVVVTGGNEAGAAAVGEGGADDGS